MTDRSQDHRPAPPDTDEQRALEALTVEDHLERIQQQPPRPRQQRQRWGRPKITRHGSAIEIRQQLAGTRIFRRQWIVAPGTDWAHLDAIRFGTAERTATSTPQPRPRAHAPRRRRRPAASSRTSGTDPGDDAGEPPAPALVRSHRWGRCTRRLLGILERSARR